MFYPEFREVIVTRITLPVAHRRPLKFFVKEVQIPFPFSFLSTQRVEFGTVVGVTDCHADGGRRIADRCPVAIERLKIDFAND
jgi:hypothetical protein